MHDPSPSHRLSPFDTEVVENLLDEWEAALEDGRHLPTDELCRGHPHLEPVLRQRIQALLAINVRLQSSDTQSSVGDSVHWEVDILDLSFVAKGGLGTVYVGKDSKIGRCVAIKFMHEHLAADPQSNQRFALESEVTGRLEHPGVIPLYGIGRTTAGLPYYAMRFIDGESLDEAIKRYFYPSLQIENAAMLEQSKTIEFRRLLTAFVSICKTIAYAHNRGIVHRDIKPANVMLGRYGETIVVDWGLAVSVVRDDRFRASGEKSLLPTPQHSPYSSGRGAGTPAYMSPEQASDLAPTPASDIYSLGATLFKILCGKPPVDGESLAQIKEKIVQGQILRASQIESRVPKPLEAICAQAMSLQPSQRYLTALDLAAEVERFLADEPVEAFCEPPTARLARFARHHRLATQAVAAGLCSCLLIAGVATIWLSAYATRENAARIDAQTAQQTARTAQLTAERTGHDNLAMSAQFLAKSIAQEIDLRWRVLEAEAGSSILRRLVTEYNAKPPTGTASSRESLSEIQQWLEKRFIAHNSAIKTASWFINAADGTQLARSPEGPSIGQNFAHRDYITGLKDRVVHLSVAFESASTKTLVVAFTVPIWNDGPENYERARIGILGMAVEVGDFSLGKNSWLVDTRPDSFSQQRGLVLHHPNMGQRRANDLLPRVSAAMLERAATLRQSIAAAGPMVANQSISHLETVADPIDGSSKLVALSPVIISGRPSELADSGWIVVVTEGAQ